MKKNKKSALNNYEKNLLSSFEKSELQSVKNLKKEKNRARKMASDALHKSAH